MFRRTIARLMAAAFAITSMGWAQQFPTNVMVFHGRVTTTRKQPLDGVVVKIIDQTTGYAGTVMTPTSPGVPGTYFLVHNDWGNATVARANDLIRIEIQDPRNRFKRPLKSTPSRFYLGKGDASACIKKLDLIVY